MSELYDTLRKLIRQELARQAAAAVGDYQIHVIPLLVEAGLEG